MDMPCDEELRTSICNEDAEADNTDTCRFKFSVYWDEAHERWMVPHKQRGCSDHSGHPMINPEHL